MKEYTNLKVLVVDDMTVMRKILTNNLVGLGFLKENIFLAKHGKVATEILSENRVSLIISDWHMPEMNGYDLLEYCKNSNNLRTIPFVLLTSDHAKENIQQAKDLGVSEFLVKPIEDQRFSKVIKDVLCKTKKLEK